MNGCKWSVYCYVCPTYRRGEHVESRRVHVEKLRKTRQLCARHARIALEFLTPTQSETRPKPEKT
jgi:hypothetical protein